jgi:hypothetical protein
MIDLYFSVFIEGLGYNGTVPGSVYTTLRDNKIKNHLCMLKLDIINFLPARQRQY